MLEAARFWHAGFSDFLKTKIQVGISVGLTEIEAKSLTQRYGSNVDELYSIIKKLQSEPSDLPLLLRAQLVYAIENEMCCTPSDFFIRRTGLLYFDIHKVKKYKEELRDYWQNYLAVSKEYADRHMADLQNAIEQV